LQQEFWRTRELSALVICIDASRSKFERRSAEVSFESANDTARHRFVGPGSARVFDDWVRRWRIGHYNSAATPGS